MTEQKNTQVAGMAFMGMIFFLFGFVTTFNITLADKFKAVFELSNFQAQLVNGAFFFTYFVLSFTAGGIIKRIGYKGGVILGLLLVAAGSFLFFPAAKALSFPFFLFAIFIMAGGVVFLQVAANPYVTALGPSETASGRLNLTQALNSIATYLAPIVAGVFVFKTAADAALTPAGAAKSVPGPFLIIGIVVVVIAFAVYLLRLPMIPTQGIERKSVWKYPHVTLGALGIFCYVGAEVGTAAFLQRYLQTALNMAQSDAARMIALYWGGSMVGRFYGSFMLSNVRSSRKYLYTVIVIALAFFVGWFVRSEVTDGLIFAGIALLNYLAIQLGRGKAARSLAVFGIIATILLVVVMSTSGSYTLWVGLAIGFFNSIMFPNIFTLGVDGLDKGELSMASGLINTLIVGGAVIPVLMGIMADTLGVRAAFVLPIICYLYIVFYALVGSKKR
ncbi:MAG TPA: sugar MFS transporter [Bacteroidales bacterium]|nr:sugar MFS transporter [Bacteroidales bacterium]HPJ59532.1 sugar MFS transporter [Bacteroidales bacterium]HPR12069.1 sugar MFS transporter [Bacteroidales bacterium]HRW86189.1 sugar MFS transporter [Bacteroidales bacterium]